MLVCGIEEAGRGCVIGPLVMCGLVIEEGKEGRLRKLGVKDSKLLTPEKREALYPVIEKHAFQYKLVIIPPAEIDQALNDPEMNLNWLEAVKAAGIINELCPEKVIIDCPSPNKIAFTAYLRRHLKDRSVEVIAEHKADVRFPVVSAASILAKVARDNEIRKIQESIGIDFGSGYCSDPRTVEFLNNNFNKYPDIFRKTWQTYQAVLSGKGQTRLSDY